MSAGALMLLSACGGGHLRALPPPGTLADEARVRSALRELDALVERLRTQAQVPGVAVAVVYRGQTLHRQGYGLRSAGQAQAVDADTVFQLASVSKSLAATVVARQVGEGVIRWDSRVKPLLPELELSNAQSTAQLTVGHLFSHLSGLGDHAGDQLEDLGYTREQIFSRLRHVPVRPLGSHYAYTNLGLTAGAEAVARAAGMSAWEELCERTLYAPLGMRRSSSRYADFAAHSNRAASHQWLNGRYQTGTPRQPDVQSAAGGASASVKDMARWMTLVLDKGRFEGKLLIQPEALEAALTAQPNSGYGYGFNVGKDPGGRRMASHSGAFLLGAATCHMMWLDAGLGITVLTNAQPRGLAEAIAVSFSELAFDGKISKDWLAHFAGHMAPMYEPFGALAAQPAPRSPQAPRALHSYTGRYTNAYYGDAFITLQGDQLWLTLGPQRQQKHALSHWNADRFVFDLGGENASEGSRSWIDLAPQGGERGHLVIEYYSQDITQGRFEQVPQGGT